MTIDHVTLGQLVQDISTAVGSRHHEPERIRIDRLRDGIPPDATTWKQLQSVAQSLGIPGHDV